MKSSDSYNDYIVQKIRENPGFAIEYVKAAFEENGDDVATLRVALRRVAQAYGVNKLAREAHKPRQSLSRALSPGGNPTLETIGAILKPLGMRLSVEPIA
jgi:probable addiction module antidote protein